MLHPWSQMIDQILAMQEKVFTDQSYNGWVNQCGKYPYVNLYQDKDELTLTAELPGVKKEDITLEVKGDQLRLSGKRNLNLNEADRVIHRERGGKEFSREIQLPFSANAETVEAKHEDGVLTIQLHRAEEDKATGITIN